MDEPVTFVTFKWGLAYRRAHVDALAFSLGQAMKGTPFRFICVTDNALGLDCETFPLWNDHADVANPANAQGPSCYRRLKLFDAATTDALGIARGARVCSIDLDVLPLAPIAHLFNRREPFVCWGARGTRQQFVYNGSMWMHRAGDMQWMWDELDPLPDTRAANKAGYFGSDQSIMSHKLLERGHTAHWGEREGCYAFRNVRALPDLPTGAIMLSFYGKLKPWDPAVRRATPWLRKYWPPRLLTAE